MALGVVLCAWPLILSSSAAPLTGTKSIGPTGDYSSITEAIADVQTQTLGGALMLELQAAYVSTVETFPLTIPALNGASAVNTLTIRPASGGTALSISSADTTAATIDLNGAQFVTIDGRPGGVGSNAGSGGGSASQLTIGNTSPSGVALRFINEASGNTLRYTTLRGVSGTGSATVVFSTTTGANGNDNNTLDHCDLGDGASPPVNCLLTRGSTGTTMQNNSGNTVSNCNVFNFQAATAIDAAGVRIDDGNTDWNITSNSFYQTVSRAAVAGTVYAISINNTSGNNFTVMGNFIGGCVPNAGGAAWTTTGTGADYRFVGIQLNVGTMTASSVQGNTIQNIVWTSSSTASTLSGIWSGIYVQGGNVNTGTITGNSIGSATGTDSISVTTSGNGGTTFGIASGSSGMVAVANNTVGSITVNSSAVTISASLTGVNVTAGTNTIANNTIGSTSTASSLNSATSSTSGVIQRVTGILSSSSSASITGNTVANLNNNHIAGQVRGIATSAGVNTLNGNTVRNLSTASQKVNGTTSSSVLGISQSSTAAGQTVSGNTVHSLTNTAATAAVSVIGIYFYGPTNGANVIARNLVHSLAISSTSTTSQLKGMEFAAGSFTAQNNMVRVGLDADGASTAGNGQVIGLHDSGTTDGRNYYHNSVHVGGTQTSGAINTYAFSSSGTTNARNFHNNIFINARGNSNATGKHYAVVYNNGAAALPNPAGLTTNNNLFFISGTGGVLGTYNSVDCANLAAWQSATGLDTASLNADPLFVAAIGTAGTGDLHLLANSPAEGAGTLLASVTDDFDGQSRSALSPVDIGADAGDFGLGIALPPLGVGTTANRVLTGWASITTGLSIVSVGADAPRFYFKKASEPDVFLGNTSADSGWKYVIASTTTSPYSFTVDYTLLSNGVSSGDVIQYFVAAQDAAGHFRSAPYGATATGNSVQAVIAKPTNGVNSYIIFEGTVQVGPSGTFTSLSGAGGLFAALNLEVFTGSVTAKVTGDTTEDGSTALNANNATEVNIQPDSATMRTISGAGASGLIRLNGPQHLIIDGSFGGSGRYLTFRNTDPNGATVVFINDASNNTVRNCVLEGSGGSTTVGVVAFKTGVTTGNDFNTVSGNQIRDRSDTVGIPSVLVVSQGSSDTVANSDNTISNNDMFNFTSYGLRMISGSESWSVTGNTIYQTATRVNAVCGILFSAKGTNMIRGNIVRDLTTRGFAEGICVFAPTGNTTVAGNRLWKLGNISGVVGGARGISINPGTGDSVKVINNMVTLSTSNTTQQNLYGISDGGVTGSTVIAYYNTVLMTGPDRIADTFAYQRSGNSSTTVKNNLLLNLLTGDGYNLAVSSPTTGTALLAMDYNVYAGTGHATAANFFATENATFLNFTQWQSRVPSDTHSIASNPGGNYTSAMFVDAANGDLHLVPGGNVLVNKMGTPIAGVTDDYDGNLRSLTTPIIGADEILLPDISVEQPADNALTDGVSTMDFSPATVNSGSVVAICKIMNTGLASLAGLVVTIDGTNSGDFGSTQPDSTTLAPGASTFFNVTFTPSVTGVRSATIHIVSNVTGAKNPFDIALTGTGLTANESWRLLHFNTTSNIGTAADNADPNGNAIPNLLEYALNGDPTGSTTGRSILPQASANGTNHLQLAFSRYLDRNDITLIVQAGNTLTGMWTDLAQSVNGAAFAVLATDATVNETGTGNTRAVTVSDLYLFDDPDHPQRFMRLKVTRP